MFDWTLPDRQTKREREREKELLPPVLVCKYSQTDCVYRQYVTEAVVYSNALCNVNLLAQGIGQLFVGVSRCLGINCLAKKET